MKDCDCNLDWVRKDRDNAASRRGASQLLVPIFQLRLAAERIVELNSIFQ
jgi:hypothetical protein